jgi:hypothetical protein
LRRINSSLARYSEAKLLMPVLSGESIAVTTAPDGPTYRIVHSNNAPLKDANGTSVLLFVSGGAAGSRLLLIIYFHDGGYVLFRAASKPFHNGLCYPAALHIC